jgi:hypothetical protein
MLSHRMKIVAFGRPLIGSQVVCYFGDRGHLLEGIDNNTRPDLFGGPQGDARLNRLRSKFCANL